MVEYVGGFINIGGKIAEYFGLVDGTSTQVTKLVHQAFKSAKDNLENARYASCCCCGRKRK